MNREVRAARADRKRDRRVSDSRPRKAGIFQVAAKKKAPRTRKGARRARVDASLSPFSVRLSRPKSIAIGMVIETDTARPVSPSKSIAIGMVIETDTARPVSPSKSIAIGMVIETDTAQQVAAFGRAGTADSALAQRGRLMMQNLSNGRAQAVKKRQVSSAEKLVLLTDDIRPLVAKGWKNAVIHSHLIEKGLTQGYSSLHLESLVKRVAAGLRKRA